MIKRMSKTLLAVTATALLLGCQGQTNSHYSADTSSHISAAVYQLEFASAAQFHQQALWLNQAMSRYCQVGGSTVELEQNWQLTMQAWMALQGQERGPSLHLNRVGMFNFGQIKKTPLVVR